MVPAHVLLARIEASKALDRAIDRYSAIECEWRPRAAGSLVPIEFHRKLRRRYLVAGCALRQAVDVSARATKRDTRWTLAMHAARRTIAGQLEGRGRK